METAVPDTPLLAVSGLTVEFPAENNAPPHRVVDDVCFTLARGQTLALVGESGAGKSMTGLAVIGLVPFPGRVVGGSVRFAGREVLGLPERQRRALRGGRMAMIFQEPSAAMNPVFPVGEQVAEVIRVHRGLSPHAARAEALQWLARVRLREPARRYGDLPHQLSGGMLQRILIAQAMAGQPDLLIADEPTTALDAVVQREIMELLDELQHETGLALLFVTHNLGLVAEMADDVAVMQAGRIVEHAPVQPLFAAPAHPYTRELLAATPRPLAP
jgi:ABC-type dipeptide/oligopeptide/nickel transport system ATPase component